MTHEEVRQALHRIAFDGEIDSNSSRDDTPTLLAKIREHVVSWASRGGRVRETREIILCEDCKGKGTKERSKLTDYHKGEYDYWDDPCKSCGGSGRVKVTTLVRREPYRPLSATGRG